MANPLPNEQEIYDRIKRENIVIHPLIWQLIDHHINNELFMINLIIGSTVIDKEELSAVNAGKVLNHTRGIKNFLEKLSGATTAKPQDT